MIIAFDLDGTLCNIEHRLHFIRGPNKLKDWPAFFRACINDAPVYPIIRAARAMAAYHTVEVWSGRSDVVREQTATWLNAFDVPHAKLRMRVDGDYRKDCIVKGEWYDALAPGEQPRLAFDDRQQVVDMWRSRGVICCQVAPGDF